MIKKRNIKVKKPLDALRVNLDADDSKKFNALQSILGIKSKSDVTRFCLTFTYSIFSKNKFSRAKNIESIIGATLKTEG